MLEGMSPRFIQVDGSFLEEVRVHRVAGIVMEDEVF